MNTHMTTVRLLALQGIILTAAFVIITDMASAQVPAATPAVIRAATSSCPVKVGYLSPGAKNRAADVARVQAFLKTSERADVDVTGIYDERTIAAVMAFQKRNAREILAPWGGTQSSGIVNITTVKKINQIACGAPLVLDQRELMEISGWKRAAAAARSQELAENTPSGPASGLGLTELDQTSAGPAQSASASAASDVSRKSVIGRFGDFLRGLFGGAR